MISKPLSSLGKAVFTFAVLVGLSAGAANAAITIQTGNPGNQGTDNILFNDPNLQLTGFTVQGHTNATPSFIVDFTSTTELQANGGQARIEALGYSSQNPVTFSDLEIDMNDPLVYFTKAIFNINADTLGDVTITAYALGGGSTAGTFALGNGQNFFNVVASNGTLIDYITIVGSNIASVDFQDARQIRLGGVQAVPEPGFYGIVGVGVRALFVLVSRRRKTQA